MPLIGVLSMVSTKCAGWMKALGITLGDAMAHWFCDARRTRHQSTRTHWWSAGTVSRMEHHRQADGQYIGLEEPPSRGTIPIKSVRIPRPNTAPMVRWIHLPRGF